MRNRYIPRGAVKIADKHSDAIAYLYEDAKRGRPCALVYYGKQSKAVAHHSYPDAAKREASVARYFAGRQAHDKAQADYKAKRLAPNLLVTGDILSASWGYDQTNVDFYEVTAVAGQYVLICPIAAASVETLSMQGTCVPQSGSFTGPAVRKLVQYGDSVSIKSYITARKWNTGEVAGVKIGPAMRWSSYA